MVTGKPGVGEVLAAWMNREGVSPTQLARQAQVSRATVYVVLDSRSNNPGTMRQLARGLAVQTSRHGDETIDPQVEDAALRELLSAIGFEGLVRDPATGAPLATEMRAPDTWTEAELEAALADLARDPEIAALIAEAARKYPDMTPGQRTFFLEALRRL